MWGGSAGAGLASTFVLPVAGVLYVVERWRGFNSDEGDKEAALAMAAKEADVFVSNDASEALAEVLTRLSAAHNSRTAVLGGSSDNILHGNEKVQDNVTQRTRNREK